MSSFEGVIHKYCDRHVAFEFAPAGRKKVLIFVGGLTDGLLTVPYVGGLADALALEGFSTMQMQFSSSFKGFGTSSLDKDVDEIDQLVDYLKKQGRETILLMGHSTGSQDTIHYLLKHPTKIQGGIMQAPVSDRENFCRLLSETEMEKMNEEPRKLIEAGKGDDILSTEHAKFIFGTPITAYRWGALIFEGGDDDYFSSDLSEETLRSTFGEIKTPFLIAYSGSEEFVPESVDKNALVSRWQSFSDEEFWSKSSGLIPGASHNVSQKPSQEHLFKMVTEFVKEFSL